MFFRNQLSYRSTIKKINYWHAACYANAVPEILDRVLPATAKAGKTCSIIIVVFINNIFYLSYILSIN
jgi:hypothetical protein